MRFKNTPGATAAAEIYKAARREFKYALRKAKNDSWRNFVKNQSSVKDFAHMCKNLGETPIAMGLVKSRDGVQTENPEDAANVVMDTFFPGSVDKAIKDAPRPELEKNFYRQSSPTSVVLSTKVDQEYKGIFSRVKISTAI